MKLNTGHTNSNNISLYEVAIDIFLLQLITLCMVSQEVSEQ